MWLLFAYDTYYPNGGMSDCYGIFYSQEELLESLADGKLRKDRIEAEHIVGREVVSYRVKRIESEDGSSFFHTIDNSLTQLINAFKNLSTD